MSVYMLLLCPGLYAKVKMRVSTHTCTRTFTRASNQSQKTLTRKLTRRKRAVTTRLRPPGPTAETWLEHFRPNRNCGRRLGMAQVVHGSLT